MRIDLAQIAPPPRPGKPQSGTRMQLPVEGYPLLSDVTHQVTAQGPELPAEEVEQLITIPLARTLSARSRRGLAAVRFLPSRRHPPCAVQVAYFVRCVFDWPHRFASR